MCHTSLAYIWPIYFSFFSFFFFVSSVQFLKFEPGHGKMFSVCLFVASLCNCFHVSLENYCRFSCIVTPHLDPERRSCVFVATQISQQVCCLNSTRRGQVRRRCRKNSDGYGNNDERRFCEAIGKKTHGPYTRVCHM